MNFSVYVRLWGGLDVAYVLWRVVKDVSELKVPFLGSFGEPLSAAAGFGQTSISILTAVGVIVTLSIIFSGPLMLMLNRVGVYVSLFQFPFRLTLLVPPTFFFIQSARVYLPGLLLIMAILTLELVKVVTEIVWLKRGRGQKGERGQVLT